MKAYIPGIIVELERTLFQDRVEIVQYILWIWGSSSRRREVA
jgi:hypothetical protein